MAANVKCVACGKEIQGPLGRFDYITHDDRVESEHLCKDCCAAVWNLILTIQEEEGVHDEEEEFTGEPVPVHLVSAHDFINTLLKAKKE